jgi:ATP-dependent protease ClpP protease subunit
VPQDPHFRPNPFRAVYIRGTIDQSLIDTLTPQILALQHQNREPITVYIDSRGGSIASAELLARLLKSTDQDGSPPCWIITVATGRAASAAADLLSDGNYALVYSETVVHFHGIRYSLNDPLTLETASFMAESLQAGNDQYAFTLARRCISRYMLRFLDLRSEFEAVRSKSALAELDDLACMQVLLSNRVSEGAAEILRQAFSRYGRYQQLATYVGETVGESGASRFAETEAAILRAILDFELSNNEDPAWSFESLGLRQLRDDFLLLIDYLKPWQNEHLEFICNTWGTFFLTEDQNAAIAATDEDSRLRLRVEAIKPILRPFWFFFVALCHVLQEGENELTAHDCYWLGLVDEVIGDARLSNLRQIVEFAPASEASDSIS